ncbi:hypothetical protein psal_cds_385 [Pandoravirus salinus]|uniref:Uncharacterized protein n=1 Tax=Pandoravirus salinus TaxID=1349410 RepID=S4W1Q8_9VIRU|nr:hypothetical protein psal_cds_385 [Pandoravirus salinus]AGO84070.1 hypothetical protein psal_cds_385 [Pandoravirus salinus]
MRPHLKQQQTTNNNHNENGLFFQEKKKGRQVAGTAFFPFFSSFFSGGGRPPGDRGTSLCGFAVAIPRRSLCRPFSLVALLLCLPASKKKAACDGGPKGDPTARGRAAEQPEFEKRTERECACGKRRAQ